MVPLHVEHAPRQGRADAPEEVVLPPLSRSRPWARPPPTTVRAGRGTSSRPTPHRHPPTNRKTSLRRRQPPLPPRTSRRIQGRGHRAISSAGRPAAGIEPPPPGPHRAGPSPGTPAPSGDPWAAAKRAMSDFARLGGGTAGRGSRSRAVRGFVGARGAAGRPHPHRRRWQRDATSPGSSRRRQPMESSRPRARSTSLLS